ncbi:hypothetical protein FIBSPDRAFT_444762 [Athelia psychrophila]|uniref:Uncharacterized protein n=1 Tax=Athelia psychrophila TaxID=1759441 RepID=A0A166M8E4_9AGAM|nr:hypothetical protein FIBSPDRAFT_444762 [Fibularhizoctonia sp. CBS 109695]
MLTKSVWGKYLIRPLTRWARQLVAVRVWVSDGLAGSGACQVARSSASNLRDDPRNIKSNRLVSFDVSMLYLRQRVTVS